MSRLDGNQDEALTWAGLQEISDDALVGQVLARNHDPFAVIVDRYQRLVFSVAVRIVKDEGEAEDVVQIVFLDIFRKAARFDPARGTLKVWILQCAYNRSLNRREHLDRQQLYSKIELSEGIAQDEVKQLGNRKTLEPGEANRLRPRFR
jgi:RNA polymerase sigma-70 factor (ECF subfamily)